MSSNATTKWTIDPTHAEVGFSVRHMMISTVRGRFGGISGSVIVDEQQPRNSKVDVTIDVASIDTRQDMRDNHLRSPDFFDVAKFPTLASPKKVSGSPAPAATISRKGRAWSGGSVAPLRLVALYSLP